MSIAQNILMGGGGRRMRGLIVKGKVDEKYERYNVKGKVEEKDERYNVKGKVEEKDERV